MTTSLAEQLQRLAVPQTTVFKRDKKRASLLFDPREAAGLKRETVFQIGLEGLEELISKNEIFDQFKNTLFHLTSKDFERSVQSTDANQRLDNNIRKFLLLLSPYFLLNCTHKALEWLINRYLIHEYNREDLLMLILPYHESNIFIRVVQLLQFKDTRDNFYFLKVLQKPGVHLPKQSLLNHASSDNSFLKLVGKYIKLLIKHHEKPNILTVPFNFYCSVFAGVIEYSQEITEDQVSQMLPLLLNGLNSSIPDFCAASYVVTARLVAKITLSNALLDKFVEKISEGNIPQLRTEMSLVLLVLYQSQTQYHDIPSTAVTNLSEKEWLPKVLQHLNSTGSYVLPFLETLVKRCTEEGTINNVKLARNLVDNCLEQIKLEDLYIGKFLISILDSIKSKMPYSEEAKNWLTVTVQTLERQYPNAFDKEVYQILCSRQNKRELKRRKCLLKVLKNTMAYKGKFEVLDKLYHPSSQLRKNAVRYLNEIYSTLKETDKELITNSLVDRLNDENVQVVYETLLLLQKITILDINSFINTLKNLLNKCLGDKEKWEKVYTLLIDMLCSNSNSEDWEVFLIVFPALLPNSSEEFIFAKRIINTDFLSSNMLVKNSVKQLQNASDAADFVKILFKCLQENSNLSVVKKILDVLKSTPIKQKHDYHKYVASLLLSNTLPNNASTDISATILEVLESYYTIRNKKEIEENTSTKKLFNNVYLECIGLINAKTKVSDINLAYVFGILKEDSNIKEFVYAEELTTIYLLLLLADTEESIRKLAFDIIDLFIGVSTRKSESYICLLKELNKRREEILIDSDQVSLIMFNILDISHTKGKRNVNELNAIRNYLINTSCNDDIPIYLKAGILRLLTHVTTFDILERTAKLALDILQENTETIEEYQAMIIENVVSRIDAKVIGKLKLGTNTWRFIEHAIKADKTIIINKAGDKICLAAFILNQCEKEIFDVLGEDVIKHLLDIIVEISSTTQNPEVLPAANTLDWKKGISVLEFIQDKKKLRNASCLLSVLFEILKKCLEFDEQTVVEYPKQLILSLMLDCCLKLEDEKLPVNMFNIELIVQCIRASHNPQTHHHALLLLAHTANLVPTQVLHHMMAIFTFMGSSVLRHDDAYSFQIITKIVDTIIPILITDNCINNIAKVLRVFVDAILDVPEHRRLPLYKQLLERLEVKENLYLFLLLVFEAQILHNSQEKHAKENSAKRLDIAANLCREFSPDIVIFSCNKLIKYLLQLPEEKDEILEHNDNSDNFTITIHTPKDFRHLKYILLKFTANLLASQEFVNQVAVLNSKQELELEDLFKETIINILQYIQKTSKVAEKAANTPQAHYWKIVLHHSYDILDSVNALITPQMFILVTKGLMVHNLGTVRRRVLELLNNKLQYNTDFFSNYDNIEMYALIPPIISIIEGIDDHIEPEQEMIIQTALLSLKLLTKSLAPEDPQKFVQILEFVTNLINSGKAQNNVLASILLCLAELCINLRAHAIAGLASFMPSVIKILKQQKHEEVPSVLLRSTITVIEKILDSMPLFLSPYLVKLLVEISVLICKWGCDDQKVQPFVSKLTCIKQKLGSMIPLRVLIPAVELCYNKLVEKKMFGAISALMDILAENLSNLKGPEINSNLPELTNFFLHALKFRSEGSVSLQEANAVEGHVVQALTNLILKLSESTFRPLYYKLFDWAIRSEINNEHACNKVKTEDLYFDDANKNILLLEYILQTLNAVFMYDNQKFINKERFDVLMQTLVDQLENTLGGIETFVKRNEELLTPCLVSFALATADDALWKQMNYQILLKMRHNVPQNRLVALHTLTELVKKLGEDFLPLLPETIPFLAELLEDEEENVEKACQKAVQEMERVLGEPLQKYF
ncbi:hypothetical protein NQ317_003471 [Molorchus minor]|uniref:HEAT repeat-containing protein 1 n=1 Tax=Molorchus minor TaxID=1323400 RepID=A0ABQ9K001_9CUCU|nr:hypothetical protein NQ317_003471 [Molorchus minor]